MRRIVLVCLLLLFVGFIFEQTIFHGATIFPWGITLQPVEAFALDLRKASGSRSQLIDLLSSKGCTYYEFSFDTTDPFEKQTHEIVDGPIPPGTQEVILVEHRNLGSLVHQWRFYYTDRGVLLTSRTRSYRSSSDF